MVGSPASFLAAYFGRRISVPGQFRLNQEQREKHKIHVIDFNFKQLVFSLLQQCPCSIGEVQPRFMFRVCTARARFSTVTNGTKRKGKEAGSKEIKTM